MECHAHGRDHLGREIISLIEGQTVYSTRKPGARDWPAWAYTDDLLARAGEWLARYHHAVRNFRPIDPVWRSGARALGPDEIVCHYDFRAANVVVQGIDERSGHGRPRLVGVLDWDTAGPGRPLFDLALAAWNWVPLWHVPDRHDAEAARRLRLLVSAYGAFTPYEVLGSVPDRLDAMAEGTRAMAAAGDEAMQRLIALHPERAPQPTVPTLRDRLPGLVRELTNQGR